MAGRRFVGYCRVQDSRSTPLPRKDPGPAMKDKVVKAARELGLQVDVKTLDQPTRTVAEAATAVGCSEAQIAKTLVFIADGDPVLVVASGAHRVDPEALCEIFDVAEVRQATPDEVRVATGY